MLADNFPSKWMFCLQMHPEQTQYDANYAWAADAPVMLFCIPRVVLQLILLHQMVARVLFVAVVECGAALVLLPSQSIYISVDGAGYG